MNKLKLAIAKRFFPELLSDKKIKELDASGNTGGGTGRELASEFVKRVTYKENGDDDFEDPEYDLETIQTAYNTDSYIRQGVDKYVDQIFKEGYSFYGVDSNVVEYLNLRLAYIAEATNTPTTQLLMDIAEDIVKYGNCMVVKARSNDPNAFPQGQTLTGLYGKDAIAGYFCANPVNMKCKRDEFGTILEWQQDNDGGQQTFNPEDVVHFYYKREKGNAYGTSFLVPVLDDVKALRRAEENVLQMMYRSIYPFYHAIVGTTEIPGTNSEIEQMKEVIDGMDVEGGLVTSERVKIVPIAMDKVIDGEPYLKYMESRIFSGMSIPEILWGRGDCYDEITQTLTQSGWKFWFEITKNDKIGTYNPDTGYIEYHKPIDGIMSHVSHYKGKMVHFKSKHIDIKVSPQHDMWVCTNIHKEREMKWEKIKAIDLYHSGIKNFYFMERTEGVFDSNDNEDITIPYIESKYTSDNNDIITFSTPSFMEFIGYFINKGSLYSSKQETFYISLSQKKNEQLSKVIKCIESLGLKYSIKDNKNNKETEIIIYHESLWHYLKNNFGLSGIDRHIARNIINMSKKSLNILLNALIIDDDTVDKEQNKMIYHSISERLIDNINEICVKLGYKSEIIYGKSKEKNRPIVHKVVISKDCNKYCYCSLDMISLEDYDGVMYCYNVPNHLFITRRNGKVAIQGNTANRSTGDNMASEMADRIRAISRTIEMFFNSFIVKELLMEGGYDPVLNPDQNVEFRFNDNDVEVKIKKEVHAIYKYEHNAITEDEMRKELGMDPIPDGDREKLYVELITRETLRVQSELDVEVAKASSTQTGTEETNNKLKNQGGKTSGGAGNKKSSSSKKDSLNPETIGFIKDSIDYLEDSIDNYIKDCFTHKNQILQDDIINKTLFCTKQILHILSKDQFINTQQVQNKLISLSTQFLQDVHKDMKGHNTFSTPESLLVDMVDTRISFFRDNFIQYITCYNKTFLLRGRGT